MGHTQNQIDHIIINNTWRGSLQDMRARRGADVGSHHVLIIAKVKLKLRRVAKKDQMALPLDVGKLKDPNVRKTYQTETRNRFAALQDQQDWTCINSAKSSWRQERKYWAKGGGRKKSGLQWIHGGKLKIAKRRKERSFPPDLPDWRHRWRSLIAP